jgi:hypothetical protein
LRSSGTGIKVDDIVDDSCIFYMLKTIQFIKLYPAVICVGGGEVESLA